MKKLKDVKGWEKKPGIATMSFAGKTWFEEDSAKRFYLKELADAREDELDHVMFEIDCLGSTRSKTYNKVIHEVLDHLNTLRKETK